MQDAFWQTASLLASMGIRVFPTAWQSKAPYHSRDWRTLATNQVHAIPSVFPQALFGIAAVLGPSSGIMDVEYDSATGAETWSQLHKEVAETPTVAYRSSRGVHRWFRWSAELASLGKTIPKVRGIEVRLGTDSKGIYSVVPPSKHPSGEWYQWLPGCAPWEVPIAKLPAHLLEAFSVVTQQHSRSMCEVTQVGDDWIPESGQRHQYMLRLTHLLAGTLRLPRDLVHEMMTPFSEYVGKVADLGSEGADKELKDMISTVIRPQTPEEALKEVDFGAMYESATTILAQQKKEQELIRKEQELPSHIFPGWLEHMSRVGWRCQMPRHFTLIAALTAASAAIGAGATVRMSLDQPPMGLQLYTLGVGESGSGKSKVLNKLTSVFNSQPNFATDATTEALRSALNSNPRGCLLKIVEGKQFTRMLGRYSSANTGQSSDNSILLEAWSGDTIIVMRQDAKKNLRIENPFLSVVAAIQPHNLGSFSADDVLEGLMQRLCIYGGDTVPDTLDPRAGTEFYKWFQFYQTTIKRLHLLRPFANATTMAPLIGQGNADLTLLPLSLVLDNDAQALWIEYAKWKRSADVMGMWVDGHPFRNDLVRHAEIALRIAAILKLWEWAELDSWEQNPAKYQATAWVEKPYLERAMALTEWLWQEKQRLMIGIADDRFSRAMSHGNLKVDSSLADMLRRLADRRYSILNNRLKGKQEWSLRDYYRHLRMSVDEANQEVALFQSHGLVVTSGSRSHAVNSLTTSTFMFVVEKIRKQPQKG